jgi:peptidoglycan/xylan/chitin deacetylase (PgdA/CDA1 family)
MGLFRSRSLILMYHRIASVDRDPWSLCVSPKHFREQLEVLRKYRRVRLDSLEPGGWSMGGGLSVALTFDDGYADNLHQALPLMKRYDTPATFFIATGYIGSAGEFWWDQLERAVYAQSPPEGLTHDDWHLSLYRDLQPRAHFVRRGILDRMLADCREETAARPSHRIMTSDELAKLAAEELVEIGAHTVTHPLLAAQRPEQQVAELRGSKRWLESHLGRPIRSFSYPYGGSHHYTAATVKAAADAGFTRACTTNSAYIRRSDQPLEWNRVQVPDVGGEEFEEFLFHAEG